MLEQAEFFPVTTEFFAYVEVLVLNLVSRNFQLHITARAKVHAIPVRKLQHQFLDEGRDVVVGHYSAFPLFYPEKLRLHFDFHVLLDGHLTGQAPVRLAFT